MNIFTFKLLVLSLYSWVRLKSGRGFPYLEMHVLLFTHYKSKKSYKTNESLIVRPCVDSFEFLAYILLYNSI